MNGTRPEALTDLSDEFKQIRSFEGMREKSPGIFYWKNISFLHFHDKDGSRWADVKTSDGWKQLKIPFAAGARDRAAFLKAVRKAYDALAKRKVK